MLTLISCDVFRIVRPLAYQFRTSFALREYISHIIVELKWKKSDGSFFSSLGETTTHSEPYYNGEFDLTALAYIQRTAPVLIGKQYSKPEELHSLLKEKHFDKHNRFAIAALDIAFHDAFAQEDEISLAHYLASHYEYTKNILYEVPIGISIGMSKSKKLFAQLIQDYVRNGAKKIKLKIEPGNDLESINSALQALEGSHVKIMADANSSYSLEDKKQHEDLLEIARQVDILEQPLGFDDLWSHAQLIAEIIEKKISVKICLDECIRSQDDIFTIIEQIHTLTKLSLPDICPYIAINVKISRIGGLFPAMEVARFCKKNQISIMPGGMHEYSIGRAAIVAFTALDPSFEHGDSEGAETYYPAGEITHISKHPVTLLNTNKNKCLTVPHSMGLGVGTICTKDLVKIAPKTFIVNRDIRTNHWTPPWNKKLYEQVLSSVE